MKIKMYPLFAAVVIFLAVFLIHDKETSAQVTTPEEYLGFKPGADFFLMTYEQGIGYFELLASQTDRMQIFDLGETSMGKRMKYAVLSSAENMARLDHYKSINKRLSLVRGVDDREAERLADEGKVIVWIDGGLHATEVAPAQLLPQLVYELVAGEDRKARLIRDNVIALIVFANPDGMTIVSDWYMNNVGTPYEVSRVPWLYHKYAGHDNNRDSFMSNLIETQNMNRAQTQEWFPEVLYNQHQRGPFPARIWIPPDAEPTNPNVHPIIIRWKNLIGAGMGKAFEEANQSGVISRLRYDTWYPGYLTQVTDGHNCVPILTETQLYNYATPHFYTINDFPAQHRDLTIGAFYPNPWKGGWWRIGDAVAYNKTACKAVLEVAARYRHDFLYNKYVIGKDVINKFKNEPPYGWIFSANQDDPNTAVLMLNRLILNGVEVYKADESFDHNGIKYARGSYIIQTSQPFGYFAKNILENQQYPDLRKYNHLWQALVNTVNFDSAPLRPYDGVGWTLPLQMGVDYREISAPLDIRMSLIDEAVPTRGSTSSNGSHYVFSHADNNSFTALYKILAAGGSASWADDDFTMSGKKYPKGTFIVNSRSVNRDVLERISAETNIEMTGGTVGVTMHELKKPRIALYKSWVASMDMGWIMWIFDKYGYEYHLLYDAEIKAGNLRERFDVIILPDQRANQIVNGHQKGTIHPEYVGGISPAGVENINHFVKNGGTLICNNGSSGFPIEHFDINIKNTLLGVPSDQFNCPGSILKMEYDTEHPIAFGMPENGMAFFSRGSIFEVQVDTAAAGKNIKFPEPNIVARYPNESLLLSGWMIGEKKIQGKPAIIDVPYGDGKIIMFGFNVHNRAQAYSTFKLLFNALFY